MKVYEFAYTSCIHESAMCCMSLHRTKKGARMAMNRHKNEAKKEFAELYKHHNEKGGPKLDIKFGEHEHWAVFEREVLE